MRFYTQQHRFYAGIDLHARTRHVGVLDAAGAVVLDRNLPCHFETLLQAIAPFRDGIVIGVECMFGWYWLSDRCVEHHIPFVLGHALYMKAIHGGKAKNDRIDANKIAHLLKGGNFPRAYAYPKGMRETRDVLRRRMYLVHKRAELISHLEILNAQNNLPAFGKKLSDAANRAELHIAERFTDPSVQLSATLDLDRIDKLEELIAKVELHLTRTAKVDDMQTYHRLRSIPGVGPILALVLLDDIHDIGRFDHVGQFLSYARLVRCAHESAGKKLGSGGKKIGNAHLRWAFAEAVCLFLRGSERAKRFKEKLAKSRGPGKALAILAARLARAVFHLLRKKEAFDEERFWSGAAVAARTRG
ncbi:MAG TPA: IS110 family transposase [Gemmataceae bacterium]|nr:IS110 family transposase [Gemmataceae bacterium]